jgi:glycosyltransferase involved in cell wall biosynthesis
MNIWIPTYQRVEKQITFGTIPESLKPVTKLVVDDCEYEAYAEEYGEEYVIAIPPDLKGLSKKRQWMLENTNDPYIFMIDDDITFGMRKEGKLPKCAGDDLIGLYDLLASWLDEGFIHVGISQRAFNHLEEQPWAEIGRMCTTYAYNAPAVLKSGARFDRLPLQQDFDMTLQLLELGFKNRITFEYCYGQPGSGTKGGCSAYRTAALMEENAKRLATLHPGLVHVVQKKSETEWEGVGNVRWDCNIEWKKSFGRKKHGAGITAFFKKG